MATSEGLNMSLTMTKNSNIKAKSPKRTQPPIAESVDKHILYQLSVQNPEVELDFFRQSFKELRGRMPYMMREDFCGTSFLSVEWCKSDADSRAIGVDLCKDTLAWGVEHNIKPAGRSVEQRIRLHNADVLTVQTEPADFICAMNFSYCTFKDRATLRRYFENAARGLADDGLFYIDLLGGTATYDVVEEERQIDDGNGGEFTYIWDQAYFNPINHELKCHIHFRFKDKSEIRDAFTYDWRLWTIPELNDVLLESGFKTVHIYWEQFEEDVDDPENEYMVGTGIYKEVKEVDQQESWLAYIVAAK